VSRLKVRQRARNTPLRKSWIVRQLWSGEGIRQFWVGRLGPFQSYRVAKLEAVALAKMVGHGARVEVMCIEKSVRWEVKT
jgi:hypothetical protein